MQSPDPVLVEVIRNRLASILFEASVALKRAAYSPIITETDDYSIAIFNPQCELIAQLDQLPLFLGAMPEPVRAFLAKYPPATMRPGDVYISNDPYTAGGTHKNDINVMAPIFVQGVLRLLVINKAHWADVGGRTPGSWSPDATSAFEEGLSIPPLRLYRAGEAIPEVEELILENTRIRNNNRGDLLAQLAACHVVLSRMDELFAQYDWETFAAVTRTIINQTEKLVRRRIAQIPDGEYQAREWVDDDGVRPDPIPVDVTVIVRGDTFTVDLSRCPPQCPGACGNSAFARTLSMVRIALRSLTAPDQPCNEGFFRPIKVIARPGTIVNPLPPAPVTLGNHVARAVREAIQRALAEVVPDRVVAGQFGGALTMAISGFDPQRQRDFIYVSPYAGGWGAGQGHDGTFPLMMLEGARMRNVPCEVLEQLYPLRVESYELRTDSGGPGRWRGGLGVQTVLRVLAPEVRLSVAMDRHRFAAPGLKSGGEGAHSRLYVQPEGETERQITKEAALPLPAGTMMIHRSGGGGGCGSPLERPPEQVLADLRAGYVSAAAAAETYGVMVRDGQVDLTATAARRAALAAGVRADRSPNETKGG